MCAQDSVYNVAYLTIQETVYKEASSAPGESVQSSGVTYAVQQCSLSELSLAGSCVSVSQW